MEFSKVVEIGINTGISKTLCGTKEAGYRKAHTVYIYRGSKNRQTTRC